jgi:hypothetical protein
MPLQKRFIVSEKNDPNLHFLKTLGYGFGDHLNTDLSSTSLQIIIFH